MKIWRYAEVLVLQLLLKMVLYPFKNIKINLEHIILDEFFLYSSCRREKSSGISFDLSSFRY